MIFPCWLTVVILGLECLAKIPFEKEITEKFSDSYSDKFILDLYTKSSVTIIPIKNTLQPSGQSVALQSMSTGTPVIITKTDGFWEPEVFKDSENIFFTNTNSVREWEEKINNIMSDSKLLNYIANNARDTVVRNNDLESFNRNLEQLI